MTSALLVYLQITNTSIILYKRLRSHVLVKLVFVLVSLVFLRFCTFQLSTNVSRDLTHDNFLCIPLVGIDLF